MFDSASVKDLLEIAQCLDNIEMKSEIHFEIFKRISKNKIEFKSELDIDKYNELTDLIFNKNKLNYFNFILSVKNKNNNLTSRKRVMTSNHNCELVTPKIKKINCENVMDQKHLNANNNNINISDDFEFDENLVFSDSDNNCYNGNDEHTNNNDNNKVLNGIEQTVNECNENVNNEICEYNYDDDIEMFDESEADNVNDNNETCDDNNECVNNENHNDEYNDDDDDNNDNICDNTDGEKLINDKTYIIEDNDSFEQSDSNNILNNNETFENDYECINNENDDDNNDENIDDQTQIDSDNVQNGCGKSDSTYNLNDYEIVSSAFKKRIVSYLIKNKNHNQTNIKKFLNEIKNVVVELIRNAIQEHSAIIMNTSLKASFFRPLTDDVKADV